MAPMCLVINYVIGFNLNIGLKNVIFKYLNYLLCTLIQHEIMTEVSGLQVTNVTMFYVNDGVVI